MENRLHKNHTITYILYYICDSCSISVINFQDFYRQFLKSLPWIMLVSAALSAADLTAPYFTYRN